MLLEVMHLQSANETRGAYQQTIETPKDGSLRSGCRAVVVGVYQFLGDRHG